MLAIIEGHLLLYTNKSLTIYLNARSIESRLRTAFASPAKHSYGPKTRSKWLTSPLAFNFSEHSRGPRGSWGRQRRGSRGRGRERAINDRMPGAKSTTTRHRAPQHHVPLTRPLRRDTRKKADAPFTIPMPGTSSRKRDVRPYTRGFEDESGPREADKDTPERDRALRPRFSQTACQARTCAAPAWRVWRKQLNRLTNQARRGREDGPVRQPRNFAPLRRRIAGTEAMNS
jgi:hypothetical protein